MIINVFCTASQLLWKQGCKLLQDIFKYLIVAQQRVHSTWSGFPVYSFCGFHVWPVKNNIFGCCYWIDVFWWKWSVIAYSMLGIALLSVLPQSCWHLCPPSVSFVFAIYMVRSSRLRPASSQYQMPGRNTESLLPQKSPQTGLQLPPS